MSIRVNGANRASKKSRWKAEMFFKQRGLCVWCALPMSLDPGDADFATFEHMKRRRHRRH